ncbi:MAG: hypothetical protein IPH83_07265 [Gammaproteobacteria bacterium]|nr:hypothetical protein [Gammaproteobacteria bacterium]
MAASHAICVVALVISSCQYITADDPRIMRIALPLDNEPQRGCQPDLPPGSAINPGAGELAVLIGGPTRGFRLGEAEAMELLKLACEQRAAAALPFRDQPPNARGGGRLDSRATCLPTPASTNGVRERTPPPIMRMRWRNAIASS